MTVWHLQHHHAGDDMLEVPLGWTFGAIVNDCDTNSKIRARQYTRNRHAQPVVSAAKGDAHFSSMRKCSLDFYTTLRGLVGKIDHVRTTATAKTHLI